MATRQDFTADEWSRLLQASMLASVAITAAEPSGLWGTLKEGFANARSLVGGKQLGSGLITAVVDDLATSEGRKIAGDGLKQRLSGSKPAELVTRCLDGLSEVRTVLDAEAGSDGAAFKAWLNATAQHVAEASTEGGFLGFGGVKVSEHEKATLDQIATTLGTN